MINWVKTHKLLIVLLVIVGFIAVNVLTSALGLGTGPNLGISQVNTE